MRSVWRWGAGVTVALAVTAWAADHADAPAVSSQKEADIADVYAWMDPAGEKINLAMTFNPDVAAGTQFSDAVYYVFNLASKAAFDATTQTEMRIICGFDAAQTLSCWIGNDGFVSGAISTDGGVSSDGGDTRAFAGVRNDPFFFNLSGFRAAAADVKAASGSLTLDAAGCPALGSSTASGLVSQLGEAEGGGEAVDAFAGMNVQAIVLQVDKALVTGGGPILSVWGSTHQR